ncbi:HNH endonuclease [Arthrobacter sp. R3-55]
MEGTGQIVERRASSSGASDVPAHVPLFSLDVPVRTSAHQFPTSAGITPDASRDAGRPFVPDSPSMPREPLEGVAPAALATSQESAADEVPRALTPHPWSSSVPSMEAALLGGAAAVDVLRSTAADEVRLLGFVDAADFAGKVEEIARSLEYVQVIAAQAVERARTEALQASPGSSAAASEWRTGWTETVPGADAGSLSGAGSGTGAGSFSGGGSFSGAGSGTGPGSGSGAGSGTGAGSGSGAGSGTGAGSGSGAGSEAPAAGSRASVVDDGYRDAAQFLRARLRIGIGEARRRLALAPDVLPQPGMIGQDIPARRMILAEALASGELPSRSASIISSALDKVRNLTDDATITRMEHALTKTAVETDPDFVTTMAKRWTESIDQDGPEPSEEVLRQHQGAFLRRRRRYGLHHIEIFATAEQYETLTTTMNTATNPRLTTTGFGTVMGPDAGTDAGGGPDLDRRSRAQKLLDGLTGACSLAMTTGELPSNGGLRPQLTVTIDYNELFDQLTPPGNGARTGTGTATFLGPIHPNTIRKIACDADIIPVLLGSDSRVLDIGRTTRIFPPHIRKAITARDGGCAFPDCTMPAPWCEAHHTTYWSNGGTTSTDNGTLLCSHHHHLIHKEQWRIDMTTGVPWFIPPPHIDPQQTPRRNHHHTPHRT